MPWCVYCGDIPDGRHRPPCPHAQAQAPPRPARRRPVLGRAALGMVALIGLVVVFRLVAEDPDPVPTFQASPTVLLPTTVATTPSTTRPVTTTTTRPPTTTTTNLCSGPDPGTSRPANGTELKARSASGSGRLEVRNGLPNDAIVKVVTMDEPPSAVLSVYVRASETVTISRIPRRTYQLAFGTGTRWTDETSAFACPRGAQKFEEPFDFADGDWSVTLNPVVGGTAATDSLPVGTFNGF